MTARTVAAASSFALALTVSACTGFYEVPIETPIQPKMDVSPFQRVLIAGFLAGGSEDVDANLETVRLLRSQLRTKSGLRVIDADVLPLVELATEQRNEAPGVKTADPAQPPPETPAAPDSTATNGTGGNGFDPNQVYFTAGINEESDGLFGSLAIVPEPGTLGLLAIGVAGLADLRGRSDRRPR